jgi:ketosteroid isomerase-like protein
MKTAAFLALSCALLAPARAAEIPDYAAVTAASATIGSEYFSAYIEKRWDDLEKLVAEHARFTDPTAKLVFGVVENNGKAAMMQAFRDNYAPISMSFSQTRQFASADHVIFEGELSWTLQLPKREIQTRNMPFVTILKIAEGKVIEHQDYADYQPFIAADRSSRQQAATASQP